MASGARLPSTCPGGETGKCGALKRRCPYGGLRVRIPPRALAADDPLLLRFELGLGQHALVAQLLQPLELTDRVVAGVQRRGRAERRGRAGACPGLDLTHVDAVL